MTDLVATVTRLTASWSDDIHLLIENETIAEYSAF